MQFLASVVLALVAAPAYAPRTTQGVLRGRDSTETADPNGVGEAKDFAKLLPFRPQGQPESMFKTRCINFLNHALEKGAYDPQAVVELLPKCKWSSAECDELQKDLVSRLEESTGAAKGGAVAAPASAPAPAPALLLQERKGAQETMLNASPDEKLLPGLSGAGENLYGWCDTMFKMTKSKAISEMKDKL